MESDEKEAPTESKEKETVPQGPEFIKYLMEREQAKELLRQKDRQLMHARSRNYDLLTKCEELEEEVIPLLVAYL